VNNLCKLSDLNSGDHATVLRFEGCGSECRYNLASIGLREGCKVEVISKTNGGRMLVNSSNGRVALGHGMAGKVMVTQ
jgi:Fe2+ transport system protein FeoA